MTHTSFQMPDGVVVEEVSETYGRFVIQPLERGYGVTIANSLRRVLLSSLTGVAVTAIKIDGVQQEFSTIPGVTEDVTDIILNLKGVRIRSRELGDGNISLVLRGPGTWTAADIAEATNDYEILNPDHHIATLAEDAEIVAELRMGEGRVVRHRRTAGDARVQLPQPQIAGLLVDQEVELEVAAIPLFPQLLAELEGHIAGLLAHLGRKSGREDFVPAPAAAIGRQVLEAHQFRHQRADDGALGRGAGLDRRTPAVDPLHDLDLALAHDLVLVAAEVLL